MTPADADRWMDRALALASRGGRAVRPNPLVGAVLVGPGGAAWGEGWHGLWGGPHAEVWAVREAERRGFGGRLAEAALVVTLEPCSHTGKTPPCADLVLARGIRRVVVAMADPFPAVAGRGIARLRAAGVEVTVGVREGAARRLNAPFLAHTATGRPLVTLKVAATLDGQVATASGDSRWVSGPEARAFVHRLRADACAVLVGAGTARADDPALTVRRVPLPEGVGQPLRVVLDRAGALPAALRLFTDDHAGRTLAVTAAEPPYAPALRAAGGSVWTLPAPDAHLDLEAVLNRLGEGTDLPGGARAVQSVLVEAGPGLATALLAGDLVDRLVWVVAPKLVGRGTPATGALGVTRMADSLPRPGGALTAAEASWEILGPDAVLSAWLRPA